jgi:hypothetical protein
MYIPFFIIFVFAIFNHFMMEIKLINTFDKILNGNLYNNPIFTKKKPTIFERINLESTISELTNLQLTNLEPTNSDSTNDFLKRLHNLNISKEVNEVLEIANQQNNFQSNGKFQLNEFILRIFKNHIGRKIFPIGKNLVLAILKFDVSKRILNFILKLFKISI